MVELADSRPTPSAGSRSVRLSTSSSRSPDGDELRRSFDARSFTVDRKCITTETITNRYVMGNHEIGVGGYGKVYMAKDKMFKNREVAIKKMVKYTEDKAQNMQQEVSIMKELDHPNICRLFETYEHERFMFFVLEYCEGGDLFDRIMENGKMPENTTAKVLKQVASALLYAHCHGVAHRDLKPENICFCTRDPTCTHIKVIDWGLGKFFQLTCMKSNVGSATYAAPEVLDAKVGAEGYTSTCDLWSLGVVAYISLWGAEKPVVADPIVGPITICHSCL
jgi:calcium-dependent protein kinase